MGSAPPSGLAQAVVSWDERIARARLLAEGSSPASAILAFYADLAQYQQTMAAPDRVVSAAGPDPVVSAFRRTETELNDRAVLLAAVEPALAALPAFLEWLQDHAPLTLAQAAAEGASVPPGDWRRLLRQRLEEGALDEDGPAAFVVEAVLQPFVEAAAHAQQPVRLKPDATGEANCPACASLPVAATLREEGHGARRSLVCALCFTEWDYLRIQCPACKENRFDALPVYTADTQANARIDACDSCRTYVKTIDLTKDGLAVPAVDDLATLPLDLWARERGYRRLYPNLLRL